MTEGDELRQLGELHERGILSDDEFLRAKARVLNGSASARRQAPAATAINDFRRSRDDRWLGGVCGGIARITGLAAWVWRLLFALMALCGGSGALAYLLLWIFAPQEQAHLQSGSGTPSAA
jgi:phage shock protein C